jgi:hypothetical protein
MEANAVAELLLRSMARSGISLPRITPSAHSLQKAAAADLRARRHDNRQTPPLGTTDFSAY